MTEVIMPKMGDGMEEGTLVEWLKKDGETVKAGEIIANIQTDKATLEMEAPGTGKLGGILLQAGGTVPVGKAIALILGDGEAVPTAWSGGADSGAPAIKPEMTPGEPVAAPPTATAGGEPSAPGGGPLTEAEPSARDENGRVKASPLARRMAEERGIALSSLTGSGPGGRVVAKDLEGASTPTPAAAPVAVSESVTPISPEDRIVKLNKIRQITAKRTQESKSQVPHFYVTVEVDLERIIALREQFEAEDSGKVSINDFVVKACALALREMPEVNAVFQGDSLAVKGGVHVGIAVALPDGLTVPVVKDADRKGLRQISSEVRDLARRAKENKLSMDELSGSTFSISNMGMLDVDNFLAIVNQPNAAIVAISSARKKVVANEDDEIEVRTRMNVSGSFDHRVADGAIGAKFMNLVRAYLENPTRLLG